MRVIRTAIALGLLLVAAGGQAAQLECNASTPNVEEYRYSWRLRGGLGWVAGLVFPRTGFGDFRTTYATDGQPAMSELVITSPQSKGGYYKYESQMDPAGAKTLTTFHGYAWGAKWRRERTVFDYTKHLARIHKETPKGTEDRVKLITPADMRDILTAIQYFRVNASSITSPVTTSIYSDGKEYPVIFRPAGTQQFRIGSENVRALGFQIGDAPGGKRWPGGVRLWITDDSRRIPVRIEILESFASLQLDLQAVTSCGFLGNSRTAATAQK